MKTAEEWIFETHPEVKVEWQMTAHDDKFMVRMMDEYGEYKIAQIQHPVVSDEDIQDINFIKWYSGMQEQKIRSAFERYKNETCDKLISNNQ
jgi:hypothetical protein